jgi:hypothetical protein
MPQSPEIDIDAVTLSDVAGTRGQTGTYAPDADGKPISAHVDLDNNGGGGGWFFDPDPGTAAVPDDAE